MRMALAQAAVVQRDLCRVEQVRVTAMEESAGRMVARGELEPRPSIGFAGLRRRLGELTEIADMLDILKEHEDAVRALDPRLARPNPSMWPICSGR